MKFRYKRYGNVYRPVIEVRIKNKDQSVRYEVLVDSGADICLFDEEVGTAIGIDVRKGTPKEVIGVGGKTSTYYVHKIGIEVGGWPYEIEAGFMPKVAPYTVPYGLVGQKGFFDIFVVKFDLLKEEIELKQTKKE